jgi:hypothetical protein
MLMACGDRSGRLHVFRGERHDSVEAHRGSVAGILVALASFSC